MSTHFTPGPWLYRAKSDAVYTPPTDHVYQFGEQIFRFHDEDGPSDADLDLILAAPDLLEALQEAQVALGMMLSYHGQRQQDYADAAQTRAQDAYDIVIEAIAKALGEKND